MLILWSFMLGLAAVVSANCYEATPPGYYCTGVAQIDEKEGSTNANCRNECDANSACNGYGYWPTVRGGLCRIHSDTSCLAARSSYGDAQGYSRITCPPVVWEGKPESNRYCQEGNGAIENLETTDAETLHDCMMLCESHVSCDCISYYQSHCFLRQGCVISECLELPDVGVESIRMETPNLETGTTVWEAPEEDEENTPTTLWPESPPDDPCNPNPCKNGMCVADDWSEAAVCMCDEGYGGDTCGRLMTSELSQYVPRLDVNTVTRIFAFFGLAAVVRFTWTALLCANKQFQKIPESDNL